MNSLTLPHESLATGESVTIWVPDMRCGACSGSITTALEQLAGVEGVAIDLASKRVDVAIAHPRDLRRVEAVIADLGFSPVVNAADASEQLRDERKQLLSRLGVAGIGMMQVMMYAIAGYVAGPGGMDPAYEALFRWASMGLAIMVAIYSAGVFHEGAFNDLRHGRVGMDVPVSLAILSACGLSVFNTLRGGGEVYFDTVAMFTFFLLIARYVESTSRLHFARTRELTDVLLPETVTMADGSLRALRLLVPGDRVRVLPGDTIPVDGLIRQGASSVTESAFTGEVLPVARGESDAVMAGTQNIEGELLVELTAAPGEFLLDRLSALHETALRYRPPFSRLADQIARYFVAVILLLASGTGLYWFMAGSDLWFQVMLTVLVVSCPCALSLATPVAYTVATTLLRQQGVVVNDGAFLERLAAADEAALDKTGTLTSGRISLARIITDGIGQNTALQVATALEKDSLHPIARAFDVPGRLASEVRVIPGKGVRGTVDGETYLLGSPALLGLAPPDDGLWIGLAGDDSLTWFALEDPLDDRTLASSLAAEAVRPLLVTGDSSAEADRVARELGIREVHKGLLPEDKIDVITARQDQGKRVLMVGDGINDTGAMGAAFVSLAVRPVDGYVQTAADATLLGDSLTRLPGVIRYSRRVRQVIRQNIAWALGYNLMVIPMAVTGFILPWMAALGMSLSSILVVLNAQRLTRAQMDPETRGAGS